MLHQLVREDDRQLMSIAELNDLFIPPTPEQVIFRLKQGTLGTLRGVGICFSRGWLAGAEPGDMKWKSTP